MPLGLSLWGGGRGALPWLWNNLCGSRAAAQSPGQDRSKGRVCHYRRPDKKSIPFQLLCTKPGPPGAAEGWGGVWRGEPPHPASPKHDSSNSLSTQGKIKTDGAAPVILMNETRQGGQPEGNVFAAWLCRASSQGPLRREIRSSWPNPPCCPGNSTDAGGQWEEREELPNSQGEEKCK